jgi:hypothetical protein
MYKYENHKSYELRFVCGVDNCSIPVYIVTKLMFRFVVFPSSTYLFTVGVEGFCFHLITLKHTPQSGGLLWTRDRPVAETST